MLLRGVRIPCGVERPGAASEKLHAHRSAPLELRQRDVVCRSGRYRIRPEAGGFIVSHSPSGRVWYALRDDAFASIEEAKAFAQAHHDAHG